MSDNLSNNYNYGQSYSSNFGRHIEQNMDGFGLCFNEYQKRQHYNGFNQSPYDLLRFGSVPRGEQEHLERTGADYIEKLERLSSNLVHLLTTARQNAAQNYHPPSIVAPNEHFWTNINARQFGNIIPCNPTLKTNDFHQAGDELIRRQKHNKVERRRRSIINDRITELRNLLPEDISRGTLGRKSNVLKEAVDYIRKLHTNIEQIHQLEIQLETICSDINQMSRRLDKLETESETESEIIEHFQEATLSIENSVVNEKTVMSHASTSGTKSILDLTLQQHTVHTENTPLFESADELDETSIPALVDTTASLESSLGLDFDVLNCVVPDDDIVSKL